MDRHTGNFGFLRDIQSGKFISMAPNFDNNIALISRGYPQDKTREKDGIIRFFRDFIADDANARHIIREIDLPEITEEIIEESLNEVPIEADGEFIKTFILNGQTLVNDIIYSDDIAEDEQPSIGLIL